MRLSNFTTKTQRHKGSTKKATLLFVLPSCLRAFVVCLFFFNTSAFAQSPNEIIKRAIKAHGGADALAKMKSFERIGKGKCVMVGSEVDAVYSAKLSLPDRVLFNIEMTLPDAKMKTTIGINGLAGWVRANNDPARDLASAQFDVMADEAWIHYLCTIAPLEDKKLKFAALPDGKVENKPAVGVRVSKDGRPDVLLYFSKDSNLLVKAEAKVKDAGSTLTKEWIFSDHKEFSGVRLPTKTLDLQNTTRLALWTSIDYKFVDKFDLAMFKKP